MNPWIGTWGDNTHRKWREDSYYVCWSLRLWLLIQVLKSCLFSTMPIRWSHMRFLCFYKSQAFIMAHYQTPLVIHTIRHHFFHTKRQTPCMINPHYQTIFIIHSIRHYSSSTESDTILHPNYQTLLIIHIFRHH